MVKVLVMWMRSLNTAINLYRRGIGKRGEMGGTYKEKEHLESSDIWQRHFNDVLTCIESIIL